MRCPVLTAVSCYALAIRCPFVAALSCCALATLMSSTVLRTCYDMSGTDAESAMPLGVAGSAGPRGSSEAK
eukprot:1530233-Rhodomonas_salina.1